MISFIVPIMSAKQIYTSIFILVLILLCGFDILYFRNMNSPEVVFDKALQNSLHITSVLATETLGSTNKALVNKLDYIYDFRDPQNSKVYSKFVSNTGFISEQFGYNQNYSIRYESLGTASEYVPLGTPPLHQWIQLKKNNVAVNDNLRNFQTGDPASTLLGYYIFGNFSIQDRQRLTEFAAKNKSYNYDRKKVSSTTVDGQGVYVYPISIISATQTAYNLEAAHLLNISPKNAQDLMDEFHFGTFGIKFIDFKLYISKSSKRLIRIESHNFTDNTSNITDFKNYDTTEALTVPTPSF